MATLALYGGTFDPFHKAHLAIVKRLSRLFDRVAIIPTRISYYKSSKRMFSFGERCNLISKELEENNLYNCYIDTIEELVDDTWRFSDTLRDIIKQNKDLEVYLVLGGDSFISLKTWENWEYIIDNSNLVVINRPGYSKEDFPKDIPYKYIADININLSSTEIRNKIRSAS